MIELFSLGELYVSDFLKEGDEPRGGKHELKLVMDEDTRAVRLEKTAPLDVMFGKYFYRSGINETMKRELKSIVDSITPLIKLKENDVWLDIASNDGTLLSYVPKELIRIGIDPADDTFKVEAEQHATEIIQSFFTKEAYDNSKYGNQKAKVATAIAMFYDLEDPDKFLRDVYNVLDDEGLFVMQLSHSGLMIEQLAFDNILSEHVYYYTLSSLTPILNRNGFDIVDCQLNDTNGGSFRVYIRKINADRDKFANAPYRDVCMWRINGVYLVENQMRTGDPQVWIRFHERINELRDSVNSFIKEKKSKGFSIWAYAASTKGNTLLQYFDLDNTLIDAVAERSTFKWGLKTVGTNIPIKSEQDMRDANPEYVLVLAWHFISSFVERESLYLARGGKFIVPCPKFKIIEQWK